MRLIDADALSQKMLIICNDCEKRKGMKNGKVKFIYQIGDAPCRACWVDDIKDEIDNAPTVDAVEIVRCKDCKWHANGLCNTFSFYYDDEAFCSYGVRKGEEDDLQGTFQ